MDDFAAEVWRHGPALLQKLEGICGKPRAEAKRELLEALAASDGAAAGGAEESKPTVEDYEYALQMAILSRLDSDDDARVLEVADMLDATAAVVLDTFERAAEPGMVLETERCKAWWTMLLTVAEDAARSIPTRLFDRFVANWEESLVELRDAYLRLAAQRLREFDAKQEAEAKAPTPGSAGPEAAAAAAPDGAAPRDQRAEAAKEREREVRRVEERRKMITHVGISPNGQLYLALTSLLKQLISRLCGSAHAALRSRLMLLLERLLAMDHKAIANNQKLRTQSYIQPEDLDREPAAAFGAARAATGVGSDPLCDVHLYQSFWGLQDTLQYPERLFEKPENWSSFHRTVSKLLGLFQKHPAQDEARQPWAPPEPAPLRQAPTAHAFAVQLDDPGFRQQFLSQVMIAFQALEQDTSMRRVDAGGLIARQADGVKAEFQNLKKLCEAALLQTRRDFPGLLKQVLEREAHWVTWKGHGCREFERESLEMLNAKVGAADAIPENLGPAKPARPDLQPHLRSLLKTLRDPQWRGAAPCAAPEEAAAAEAEAAGGEKKMRAHAMRSRCDTYLDRLIEEDKQENEIEEDCKMKKNKVFMWQCRRLFNQQYLRVYSQKDVTAKNDFMDFVRSVKGYKPLAAAAASPSAAAAGQATDGEACVLLENVEPEAEQCEEVQPQEEAAAVPAPEPAAAADPPAAAPPDAASQAAPAEAAAAAAPAEAPLAAAVAVANEEACAIQIEEETTPPLAAAAEAAPAAAAAEPSPPVEVPAAAMEEAAPEATAPAAEDGAKRPAEPAAPSEGSSEPAAKRAKQ